MHVIELADADTGPVGDGAAGLHEPVRLGERAPDGLRVTAEAFGSGTDAAEEARRARAEPGARQLTPAGRSSITK